MLPASSPETSATAASNPFQAIVKYSRRRPRATRAVRSTATGALAGILLWRLRAEDDPLRRERTERTAHRLVGICFLALAVYVAAESLRALWIKAQPERSIPGILIALAAVVMMPLLGRAKRRGGAPMVGNA